MRKNLLNIHLLLAVSTMSNFKWCEGETDRISLLPIRHHDIWEYRKKLEALHWTAQEIDLSEDRASWKSMTTDQQHFVKMQLAFFATIDISVIDNIGYNFSEEIDCLEAKAVFSIQQDQEWVHTEGYGMQIEAIIEDEAEREDLLNAARTMPIIKQMRNWVMKWFSRSYAIGERLVAFAFVEGVLFSASFSSIQWLRELGFLPGVTSFNEYIVRDENVHTEFSALLVDKYVQNKPTQELAYAILGEVIFIIDDFVEESIAVSLVGISVDDMKQYVRFQADRVLALLEYDVKYGASNPFPFMDKLALNEVSKTNFFEHRPTQYQMVTKKEQSAFALADF